MAACPSCGGNRVGGPLAAGSYCYAHCADCGLLRLDPLPVANATAALYGADYFSSAAPGRYADYIGDEKTHRQNARRFLRRLAELGPPGTLVEIGSAAGFLLNEAQVAGWGVAGVEVSEAMTVVSRERFGLEIVKKIADLGLPAGSVDTVVANQVIEHLVDPLETLSAARALLRPGGMLLMETWDIGSAVARVFNSKWQQVAPPFVVWLWDRRQLKAILGRAGFRTVSIKSSMKWVSLRTVLGQMGFRKLATYRATRTSLPYALGDLVVVTARA